MTAPTTPPPTTADAPIPPGGRYAGLVWATAAGAYAAAVLNRSSFGVAGIEASRRFDADASTLAAFVVVQLLVYAGLQLPAGVLLDRLGPRRMIATGAALMSAGQVLMAVVSEVEPAIAARVLVGAGDALTFVSVIRLLPAWFPPRRVPLVTQLTGLLGMTGQGLAAVPLVLLLGGPGWSAAFGAAAGLSLVVAGAVVLLVRDAPRPSDDGGPVWRLRSGATPRARRGVVLDGQGAATPRESVAVAPGAAPGATSGTGEPRRGTSDGRLRAVVREPGTWLGFWMHLTTGYSTYGMVLLWAFPFLVSGQGRSAAEVSALLTVNMMAIVVSGPVVGHLSGRHPDRRVTLAVVVAVAVGLAWTGLLLSSEPLPLWALAVFMAVIAVGSPASLVGLDVARSMHPPERMGTATGIVNAGAFTAALVMMLVVGVLLELLGDATGVTYPLGDYRAALAPAVGGLWVTGMVGIAVSARRVAATHRSPRLPAGAR